MILQNLIKYDWTIQKSNGIYNFRIYNQKDIKSKWITEPDFTKFIIKILKVLNDKI